MSTSGEPTSRSAPTLGRGGPSGPPNTDKSNCHDRDGDVRDQVADSRIHGADGQKARVFDERDLFKDTRLPHDTTVRIDDAADSGVCRARQIASLLDGAHRRKCEML